MLAFRGGKIPTNGRRRRWTPNPKPNTVLLAVALNDGKLCGRRLRQLGIVAVQQDHVGPAAESAYGPVRKATRLVRLGDRHDGFHRHDQDDDSVARHGVEMGGHIRDVRRLLVLIVIGVVTVVRCRRTKGVDAEKDQESQKKGTASPP